MIEVSIAHDIVFNSLSEFAQLLYLKVLPHTDDYGRFEGNPTILKARVDPMSSKKIECFEEAMLEISRSGLWVWYITDRQKYVIQYNIESFERINAFLIKQRGNPEYDAYDESYKIISGDMESYKSISKGMQGITHSKYKVESNKYKEERKKKAKYEFSLESIPADLIVKAGFDEAWQHWVNFRKEINKPLTETMVKNQFIFLTKQPDPVMVLTRSIQNGWQGLFEIKENGNGNSKSGYQKRLEYKFKPDNYKEDADHFTERFG